MLANNTRLGLFIEFFFIINLLGLEIIHFIDFLVLFEIACYKRDRILNGWLNKLRFEMNKEL